MKNFIWVGEGGYHNITSSNPEEVKKYLLKEFNSFKECNIDAVIFNGNNKFWKEALNATSSLGMEFHIWKPIMISRDALIESKHADWFAVSKEGKSTLENSPYVDYYKWLCPNCEGVKKYLLNMVDSYTSDKRISSMHLDYIRYCDLYIPEALLSKYNLERDKYYPKFDFCYCDRCVKKFEDEYGVNPRGEMSQENSMLWQEFRVDSITTLVKSIKNHLVKRGIKTTAAVFPGPKSIAEPSVRQRWVDWELDAYFPMNYNSFYNKDTNWLGDIVNEERTLAGDDATIYSGLYLNGMSPNELKNAIQKSMEAGADGISLYADNLFRKDLMKVFKETTSIYK